MSEQFRKIVAAHKADLYDQRVAKQMEELKIIQLPNAFLVPIASYFTPRPGGILRNFCHTVLGHCLEKRMEDLFFISYHGEQSTFSQAMDGE